MNDEQQSGKGKYEVRYYFRENRYGSYFTDNWFKYMWLRLTKRVIYYKVMKG